MRILSWNINGIRAGRGKASIKDVLDSLAADVVCLQETKVTRDMIDEPTAIVEGYDAYFSFSRKRSGYSGTANYCVSRAGPVGAEEGLTGRLSDGGDSSVGCYGDTRHLPGADLDSLDAEGRCVVTMHEIRLPSCETQHVAIINVYVPLAGEREDRLEYKIKFLGLLQGRAEALISAGFNVIILGDLNLTHKQLDNCDVETRDEKFLQKSSRIWFNNMLREEEKDKSLPKTNGHLADLCPPKVTGGHFSDVFRRLHPSQAQAFTCWCTATDARKANYGRRLDYILVTSDLATLVTSCDILPDVHGSDHCPVVVTLNCDPVPAEVTPNLCTRLMPEFKGQQQKLSSFFSKTSKSNEAVDNPVSLNADSLQKKMLKTKAENCSSQMFKKSVLKRSGSEIPSLKSKLQKGDSKGKQQSNLASFFTTEKPKKSDSKGKQKSTSAALGYTVKDDFDAEDFLMHRKDLTDVTPISKVASTKSSDPPSKSSSDAWKSLLGGLPPVPRCPGHKEPCVLKLVKKSGPNRNKQFYCCPRPDGPPGNKDFRCNFFKWLEDVRKESTGNTDL